MSGAFIQAANQAVNTLQRFIELPLLLYFLGTNLTSDYITLTALSAIVSFTDGGLVVAARNRLAAELAQGRPIEASRTFSSAFAGLSVLFCIVVLLIVASSWMIASGHLLTLSAASTSEAGQAFAITGFAVGIRLYISLYRGILWAAGRYTDTVKSSILQTILEQTSITFALLCGGGITHACIAILLSDLLIVLHIRKRTQDCVPGLRGSATLVRSNIVRQLAKPSLASLSFPIGYVLNMSGSRLIVGQVFGADALVTFTAIRTLSRSLVQAMMIIYQVVEPELARRFGLGDMPGFRHVNRTACRMTLWCSGGALLLLIYTAPTVLSLWVAITEPPTLTLNLLLWATVPSVMWLTASRPSYVTNRHVVLGISFLVLYGMASLIGGYALSFVAGVPGVALALLLGDVFMLVLAIRDMLTSTDDRFLPWLRFISVPPIAEALAAVRLGRTRILRTGRVSWRR